MPSLRDPEPPAPDVFPLLEVSVEALAPHSVSTCMYCRVPATARSPAQGDLRENLLTSLTSTFPTLTTSDSDAKTTPKHSSSQPGSGLMLPGGNRGRWGRRC